MLLFPFLGLAGPTAGFHTMMGFLLESFAFISLALTLGALRRNAVLTGLLGALCIGYALTGIGQFLISGAPAPAPNAAAAGPGIVGAIGGGFLWLSALCAYYLGAALLVNSTWHRRVLPVFGQP